MADERGPNALPQSVSESHEQRLVGPPEPSADSTEPAAATFERVPPREGEEGYEEYEAQVDAGLVDACDEAMSEGGEDIPLAEVRKRLGL